jgi:hypothetical protein
MLLDEKKYNEYYKKIKNFVSFFYFKHNDLFKSISYSFNDIKQETYKIIIETIRECNKNKKIEDYREKYFWGILHKRISYHIHNLLRDNKITITDDIYIPENGKIVFENNYLNKKRILTRKTSLNIKEIKRIIKNYARTTREYKTAVLKICYNYKYSDIGKELSMSDTQANRLFINLMKRMKKHLKTRNNLV